MFTSIQDCADTDRGNFALDDEDDSLFDVK